MRDWKPREKLKQLKKKEEQIKGREWWQFTDCF
jgi:hypothetical protein